MSADGHRNRKPVHRRSANQSHGSSSQHSPHSDFWPGMRGWRRRNCARCRLRSRLSFAGGGSGIGGALFLALQREDLSVTNLISSGLFADGSAAVIVTGAEFESSGSEISGPKILATRSVFYPGTEEMKGWNISEKGFRIVLSTEVPNLIRQNLGRDVDAFLADNGYRRSDLQSWVLHTGGPKVFEAYATALGLYNGQLNASWDCLRKVGNLSSASVLVVLEDVIKHRRPEPGAMGLLAAMGPGFCSELLLLQW